MVVRHMHSVDYPRYRSEARAALADEGPPACSREETAFELRILPLELAEVVGSRMTGVRVD